jgi:hypothetical protein
MCKRGRRRVPADLVIPSNACLDAMYGAFAGTAPNDIAEAMFTIEPRPTVRVP